VKAPNPDRVAQLQERAARLGELKEHPSWQELRSVFEARRRKHYDNLSRQLIAGSEVDQRYVDRMAGFFKGAEWLLDNPDFAESSLRAALKRAELFGALSEETE
jgi:hypothetical protein